MTAERNGWGGARPGAGRPKKPPVLLDDLPQENDPLRWLENLMRHEPAPVALRIEAAKALLPYVHQKAG